MATYYFYTGSSDPGNLNTLASWWADPGHTKNPSRPPMQADTAIIESPINMGTCNAGISVIRPGAMVTQHVVISTGAEVPAYDAPQFNGDVRVLRFHDWRVGVRFYRMAIGPNGKFIGPVLYRLEPPVNCQNNRVSFQHAPWQISLTTNQSYASMDDYCTPDVPGSNAIVEIKASTSYFDLAIPYIYGECNAGLLFITNAFGQHPGSPLDYTGYTAMLTHCTINSDATFHDLSGYSPLKQCVFNGAYCVARNFWGGIANSGGIYAGSYFDNPVDQCVFNGPSRFDMSGVISSPYGEWNDGTPNNVVVPFYLSSSAFNAPVILNTNKNVPPQFISQVTMSQPLSLDDGTTWTMPTVFGQQVVSTKLMGTDIHNIWNAPTRSINKPGDWFPDDDGYYDPSVWGSDAVGRLPQWKESSPVAFPPASDSMANAVWDATNRTLTSSSASGPTASEMADAVWSYINRTLTGAGSEGSGGGGLTEEENTALMAIAAKCAQIGTGIVPVYSPVNPTGYELTLVCGDDYTQAANQTLEWTDSGAWPDLSVPNTSLQLTIRSTVENDMVVISGMLVSGSSPQTIRFQPTHANTRQLIPAGPHRHRFAVEATLGDAAGTVRTLVMGTATILRNIIQR